MVELLMLKYAAVVQYIIVDIYVLSVVVIKVLMFC